MASLRRSDTVKRLVDVVLAGPALILMSPVLVALGLALRISQGSPVLFRQQRPGLHGRPFTIFKFRTMVPLVPGSTAATDVQRTTRLGDKLRALSLDELPELWNVVKGDMSLVGPRPLLMAYLPRYSTHQARRHEVRPGITGLAQVSGRNATTWEDRLALDVRYVDEHDLRMDVDILARTIRIVLAREGIRHSDMETMPEFQGTETPEASS